MGLEADAFRSDVFHRFTLIRGRSADGSPLRLLDESPLGDAAIPRAKEGHRVFLVGAVILDTLRH